MHLVKYLQAGILLGMSNNQREEVEPTVGIVGPQQWTTTSRTSIMKREIRQSSPAGRSVVDYTNLSDLRGALETVSLDQDKKGYTADWKLPVPDQETVEESVDIELHRLWTLKSYLLLDAECEEAFDQLTEEARKHFNVPTCAISLVDIGRQFMFSTADVSSNQAAAAKAKGQEPPPPCKETSRDVAFCAHTILSRRGICVVADTKEDDRFKHNKLVTDPPYLRFYAGAPLLSPEGYKLGTFCVEGPEPRPGGLTTEEEVKLHEYASRAMRLMVQRRQAIQECLLAPIHDNLRKHAAVTTNLGGEMFRQGECVTAMKLFQESVQTLMFVSEGGGEETISSNNKSGFCLPTVDRQDEMAQILNLINSKINKAEGLKELFERVKFLTGGRSAPPSSSAAKFPSKPPFNDSCSAFIADMNGHTYACQRPNLNEIPGLFGDASGLKGSLSFRHPPTLVFPEPFRISLEDCEEDGKVDYRNFIIPLDQCSKATLFNMGLIHYHWDARPDTAMQFFDLAASLSKANTPLAFDPVALGCLNNMAQINLMYGKPNDARELLSDALARGNAALAALYGSARIDDNIISRGNSLNREQDDCKSRRLRRKLARTVMMCGHVHFYSCEYDASMATCQDALRLLHATNFEDAEAAAAWYNMGILLHHKQDRVKALDYLNKFIDRATELGSSHQVADALHRKGQVLFEIGNLYESMKPLNNALRIRQEKFGEKHADVAESLCMIGKVLQAREEYDFALNAYEEGLSIIRSQPTGDSMSLDSAQTMLEVGRAYHVQGNQNEALRVYNEVADVTRKFFGERHPYVARIVNIIGRVRLEMGEVDESIKLFEDAMKMCLEQGLEVDMTVVSDPLLRCQERPRMDEIAPTA